MSRVLKYAILSIFIITIALCLNHIAVFSIEIYQRILSPIKGYRCAYHALYKNEVSCSEYGKRAIKKYGIIKGSDLLFARFNECSKASENLKYLCNTRSIFYSSNGDCSSCDRECDKACKECSKGCQDQFKLIIAEIIKEISEGLRSILNDIKNALVSFIDSIKEKLKDIFNKPTLPKPEGNQHEDIVDYSELLSKLVGESKTIDGSNDRFNSIVDSLLEYKRKGILKDLKEQTGKDYLKDFPAKYRIVIAAIENIGKSSGVTSYGFDPAYHNDMFKIAINAYVNNKHKKDSEKRDLVYKTLSIFNDNQKVIIYNRIKLINPTEVVKGEVKAQKLLGVRRQCKEWVDWIANNNGGKSIPYKNAKKVLTVDNASSGKAVYLRSPIHAAIVIKISRKQSQNGDFLVESIDIAESNWANEWIHPKGQVPWERSIGRRTINKKYFKNWKIVDIDE